MDDRLISGVITRVSFCCNKVVRNLHLFLTETAVKSCIYARAANSNSNSNSNSKNSAILAELELEFELEK